MDVGRTCRTGTQAGGGKARRDAVQFAFVAAGECRGVDRRPTMHKEALVYEEARMSPRSYR